jgi:hypothetical protein
MVVTRVVRPPPPRCRGDGARRGEEPVRDPRVSSPRRCGSGRREWQRYEIYAIDAKGNLFAHSKRTISSRRAEGLTSGDQLEDAEQETVVFSARRAGRRSTSRRVRPTVAGVFVRVESRVAATPIREMGAPRWPGVGMGLTVLVAVAFAGTLSRRSRTAAAAEPRWGTSMRQHPREERDRPECELQPDGEIGTVRPAQGERRGGDLFLGTIRALARSTPRTLTRGATRCGWCSVIIARYMPSPSGNYAVARSFTMWARSGSTTPSSNRPVDQGEFEIMKQHGAHRRRSTRSGHRSA